jgi:hypothetical protein
LDERGVDGPFFMRAPRGCRERLSQLAYQADSTCIQAVATTVRAPGATFTRVERQELHAARVTIALRAAFKIPTSFPMADTKQSEPAMDAASLYREEIYTDRKVGTLRVLVPVTPQGAPDPARPTLYQGEAQLMTNMGPLPISFDIEARSLEEAVDGYAEATRAGVERAMRELQEMRRQASSSIVIPQSGALPPGGPLGGGGKIQLP